MVRIEEVIIVEGKYDKNTLRQVVDAVILETSGFGIFHDKEKRKLFQKLAEQRGLISIGEASDFAKCEPYIGHADYFLFDTKCDGKGGSGRQFDWQMLSNYKFDVPFILSGGIGPDDAVRIKALNHPQLLGVDVNSRFETEPAMKDAALVKRFIAELK